MKKVVFKIAPIMLIAFLPSLSMGNTHSRKGSVSFYAGNTVLLASVNGDWKIQSPALGFQLTENYRIYKTLSLGMNLHYLYPTEGDLGLITFHLEWNFYNVSSAELYTYIGGGFAVLEGDEVGFSILRGSQIGIGWRGFSDGSNLFLSFEYNVVVHDVEECGEEVYFCIPIDLIIFNQFVFGVGYAF